MKIHDLLRSPIRKNLLANFFGVGVQLLNQIVLVPFYILFWGNDLYSDWIVISAITAIFAISDVGLNNVIQNRFAMKLAEGDTRECNSLMTVNFILISLIFVVAVVLALSFLSICDITEIMNFHVLTRMDASIVFLLLVCRVFVDMYRNVENAIYRAVHNASRAILLDQTTTLFIAILTLLCIIIGIPVTWMCLLIIIPSVVMLVYKYWDVKKYYNYTFSVKQFDGHLLKKIFIPAISFMAFPTGNAIVLQGYTLVVNAFFGPFAVVLYNTTRTLCNFIKTLLGTLQSSVWPEYSIAYGHGNYPMMRQLHRKIMKVTVLASFTIGGSLLILGPFIYDIWTHGKVEFSLSLMAVYVAVLFVESLWTSSSVTLMATNNHIRLGICYILSTSLALCIAAVLGNYDYSLPVITSSLILANLLMCIYTIPAGFKLTKDKLF